MSNRVTIQDIADALGISRNTVSKALNNTGVIAEATREKVMQKAIEMGYKQFSIAEFSNFNNFNALVSNSIKKSEIILFQGKDACFGGAVLHRSAWLPLLVHVQYATWP